MTTPARYKHFEAGTKEAVETEFALSDDSKQELGFANDDSEYGRMGVRRRNSSEPAFDHIPTIEGMGAKQAAFRELLGIASAGVSTVDAGHFMSVDATDPASPIVHFTGFNEWEDGTYDENTWLSNNGRIIVSRTDTSAAPSMSTDSNWRVFPTFGDMMQYIIQVITGTVPP